MTTHILGHSPGAVDSAPSGWGSRLHSLLPWRFRWSRTRTPPPGRAECSTRPVSCPTRRLWSPPGPARLGRRCRHFYVVWSSRVPRSVHGWSSVVPRALKVRSRRICRVQTGRRKRDPVLSLLPVSGSSTPVSRLEDFLTRLVDTSHLNKIK